MPLAKHLSSKRTHLYASERTRTHTHIHTYTHTHICWDTNMLVSTHAGTTGTDCLAHNHMAWSCIDTVPHCSSNSARALSELQFAYKSPNNPSSCVANQGCIAHSTLCSYDVPHPLPQARTVWQRMRTWAGWDCAMVLTSPTTTQPQCATPTHAQVRTVWQRLHVGWRSMSQRRRWGWCSERWKCTDQRIKAPKHSTFIGRAMLLGLCAHGQL